MSQELQVMSRQLPKVDPFCPRRQPDPGWIQGQRKRTNEDFNHKDAEWAAKIQVAEAEVIYGFLMWSHSGFFFLQMYADTVHLFFGEVTGQKTP